MLVRRWTRKAKRSLQKKPNGEDKNIELTKYYDGILKRILPAKQTAYRKNIALVTFNSYQASTANYKETGDHVLRQKEQVKMTMTKEQILTVLCAQYTSFLYLARQTLGKFVYLAS